MYVAEQLPASKKKLFYSSREFGKKNKYIYCWISNSNIFLQKQEGDERILIYIERNLQDLGTKDM